MPTISEPKDLDLLNAQWSQYREWFITGKIGEATYRASLHILGLRDQDLNSEINLAIMEMPPHIRERLHVG